MKTLIALLLSAFTACASTNIDYLMVSNGIPLTPLDPGAMRDVSGLSRLGSHPVPAPGSNGQVPMSSNGFWVVATPASGGGGNVAITATAPLTVTTNGDGSLQLAITAVWLTPAAANALYAAISHQHAASAITSGVFDTNRIPDLPAGKITSGTLATARLPDLSGIYATNGHTQAISTITGLQPALDGKLATTGTAADSTKHGGRFLAWNDFSTIWGKVGFINDAGYLDTGLGIRFFGGNSTVQWATLIADAAGDLYASTHKIWHAGNLQFGTGAANMMPGNRTFSTGEVAGFSGYMSSLATQLAGKASTTHGHTIPDVSGLQGALDGKLAVNGTAANSSALGGYGYSEEPTPNTIVKRTAGKHIKADHIWLDNSVGDQTRPVYRLMGQSVATPQSGDKWVYPITSDQAKAYIAMTTNDVPGLNPRLNDLWTGVGGREPYLGLPGANGWALISTMAGARSWAALPTAFPGFAGNGSGSLASRYDHFHAGMITGSGTAGSIMMWNGPASATTSGISFNNASQLWAFDRGASFDGAISSSDLTVNGVNIPTAIAFKEPALGNPAANGYVLSSTAAGVRSWVAPSSLGGGGGSSGTPRFFAYYNSIGTLTSSDLLRENSGQLQLMTDVMGDGQRINAAKSDMSYWVKTPTLYLTCAQNGLHYPLRVVLVSGTPTLQLGAAETPN